MPLSDPRSQTPSPRELSNPTQSTTRVPLLTTTHNAGPRPRAAGARLRARRAAARADGAQRLRAQGLSESQYKAAIAADKSKAQANKAKFPKGKKTLDIADWLVKMEEAQKLKGDKVVGSGHWA